MSTVQSKKHTTTQADMHDTQSRQYIVPGNTALSKEWELNIPSIIHTSPLEFRKPTIRDRTWAAPILAAEDSLAPDGCFGTFFLWGSAYRMTVARIDNRMIPKYSTKEGLFFSSPADGDPLKPAILQMKRLSEQQGQPPLIRGMTEEQKNRLEREFPVQFTFEEVRSSADYIYEAEVLAGLDDKKLHNKRNHYSRFEQECPDWRLEQLGGEHAKSCPNLLNSWEEDRSGQEGDMAEAKKEAILTAFKYYDQLGPEGGVIYGGDCLLVFTLGEPVGRNGFGVRFEKVGISVHGTYQMISQESVRHLLKTHPELRYINREEDMGMENLRKAKESYCPAFMLSKYAAR